MKCPTCGTVSTANAHFCQNCGARLGGESTNPAAAGAAAITGGVGQTAQHRNDIVNEPEQELWQGGFSAKGMYGSWLGTLLISVVLIGVGMIFWPFILIAVAAVAVLWVWMFGYLIYRRLNVHYTLTNQRFIHQSGILVRTTDRIEVIEIDDVTFSQGIIERLLGVGSIKITSADKTHAELTLDGIDDVVRISGLIDDVRRKERRRRGVYMEQI